MQPALEQRLAGSEPACPLIVRHSDEVGRSFFADRSIKAGDVILREPPVLLLSGNPGLPARIEAIQDPTYESLRQHLFAPDASARALSGHPVLRLLRLVSKTYPESDYALRCALYWHVNAFAFGDGTALFFFASLFAHSCSPNTTYEAVGGSMEFRALCDIAAGELITISYIAAEIELQSKRLRQQKLWREKCFHCHCYRCLTEAEEVDSNAAALLRSLEDEVAGLSLASAEGFKKLDAPLHTLRDRAEVVFGESHWTVTLLLLMTFDLLVADPGSALSASTVNLLGQATVQVKSCAPHLSFSLVGERLLKLTSQYYEQCSPLWVDLRAVAEQIFSTTVYPHQRVALLRVLDVKATDTRRKET